MLTRRMCHEGLGIRNNQRDAVPKSSADGIADFRILGRELPDQKRSLFAIEPLQAFGQTDNAIGLRQRSLLTRAPVRQFCGLGLPRLPNCAVQQHYSP